MVKKCRTRTHTTRIPSCSKKFVLHETRMLQRTACAGSAESTKMRADSGLAPRAHRARLQRPRAAAPPAPRRPAARPSPHLTTHHLSPRSPVHRIGWYQVNVVRRGRGREAAEGSGWGEGRMRVSRRGRGERGRPRARSNGAKPYLSACGMHGSAGRVPTEVGRDNCARGGTAGGCAGGGQRIVMK